MGSDVQRQKEQKEKLDELSVKKETSRPHETFQKG